MRKSTYYRGTYIRSTKQINVIRSTIRYISVTLVLVLLWGSRGSEPAIGQTLPFRTYSIEHGLAGSVVYHALQDNEGYIWLATNYGVSKFDGVSFTNFRQRQGLNSKRVYTLFEQDNGDVWVGSDQGVNLIREETISEPREFRVLRQWPVTYIGAARDGGLWFGTDGGGAWHWIKDRGLRQLSVDEGIGSNRVREVLFDKARNAQWIATDEGISIKHPSDTAYTTFTMKDGLPGNKIRDLLLDPDGRLFIGTRNGLGIYHDSTFTVLTRQEGLVNNRIQHMERGEDGSLWIATEEGISVWDGTSFTNYKTENGLPADYVRHIMKDSDGKLWFSTYGGGVTYFAGDFMESLTLDNGLPNNMVSDFTQTEDGTIWIATYGGGVAKYQDGQIVDVLNQRNGLVDDKVYTVYSDSKNRLWIGTRWGFSIYQNEGFINYEAEDLQHRKIRTILEDERRNTIWMGTDDNGLIRYQNQQFTYIDTTYGLVGSKVYDLEMDDRGDLWIATDKGVSRFDGSTFRNYTIEQGLPNNGVLDIHEDTFGHIWFATYGGVAVLDGNRFHSITDALPSQVCYFIISNKHGDYWVGTNNGVVNLRFDTGHMTRHIREHKFTLRSFTHEQGLVTDETNVGAALCDQQGRFWFGTVAGLSRLDPSLLQNKATYPRIHIEDVRLFDRSLNAQKSEPLMLDSDQNYLQINYVGLDYAAPGQITYAYRLKNVDEEWQYTDHREVRFAALTPDNYTFEVRAQNWSGNWSQEVATVNFTILPPLWQRWWFRGLIVLAVLVIIYFIYRYYRIRKMVDIERMRVQIASDLHDDVGGSLTEIALQTDLLRTTDLGNEVKSTLKQIGQQSRSVVSSLDDIVWSIDARNDSFGDLTDRMQDYINNLFKNRDIEVRYELDELDMSASLPVEIRENLYLIFKEAINNVAKHSDASEVQVRLDTEKGSYVMEIQDNGHVNGSGRRSGQGLNNMNMRAKRIRANLDIIQNGGFTVRVTGSM
jgi:ligand-binding sensor domain-containing protein/two-component sensor histidine kinase